MLARELQLYKLNDLFINRIFIDSWIWVLQIIFIEVSFHRQRPQGELSLGHMPTKKYSLGPRGRKLYLCELGHSSLEQRRCGPPHAP